MTIVEPPPPLMPSLPISKMRPSTRIAAAFLFGSLAIGVAGSLGYETFAVASGKAPTISRMSNGAIQLHPHAAVLGGFCAGGLTSLLVAHFADLTRWWRPD